MIQFMKGMKTVGILLVFCNLALVATGLYAVDQQMSTTDEVVDTDATPRGAALPYQKIPIKNDDTTVRFFEDLQVDTSAYASSTVHQGISAWKSMIQEYSRKYGVDPDLVSAILYAESKGDPYRVSHAGALGLMQIMPATADFLGIDNVLDPEENIRAGVKYIAWLVSQYGEQHALWAWNAGPGRVEKKYLPNETRRFITEVLTIKTLLKENRG